MGSTSKYTMGDHHRKVFPPPRLLVALGLVLSSWVPSIYARAPAAIDAVVAHFIGDACPPGWLPHAASQGRLLLPVSTGADAGVTYGAALADGADAQHSHANTQLTASSGHVDMLCVAGGGARLLQGDILLSPPTAVPTGASGSGFPLTQLLTCVMDVANPVNANFALPGDMFAYFDKYTTTSCPAGYDPLSATYSGRLFVPFSGGDIPTLSDRAPIAAGSPLTLQHAHIAAATFQGGQYTLKCGTSGPQDDVGRIGPYSATGMTTDADTNLPYLSTLTCRKSVDALSVVPTGMLAFTLRPTCPLDWTPAPLAAQQQGSFVLATPSGGHSGTSIGTGMAIGSTDFAPQHAHTCAAPPAWSPQTVFITPALWSQADYADEQPITSSAPTIALTGLAAPYVQLRLCLAPVPSATATASATSSGTSSASATSSGTSSATASAVSTLSSTASASAMTTSSSTSTASYSATPTPTTTPSNGTSGAPAAVASAENSALAVDAVFGAFGAVVVALSLYTVVRWMRRAKPDSGDAYMRSEEEYLSREAREDPVADVLRRVRAFMRATGTGAGARSNSASTTPLIGGYAPPAAAPRSSTWEIASAWGWGAPAWGAPVAGLAPYSAEPQSSVNADPKTPDPTAGMDDRAASLSADAAYY